VGRLRVNWGIRAHVDKNNHGIAPAKQGGTVLGYGGGGGPGLGGSSPEATAPDGLQGAASEALEVP